MKLEKQVVPKYYQLEQILRQGIASGKFGLSEPLPNERELCEEHGVSRTTVRSALAALEADGMIYREQGRGTFVKYNPDKWNFQLKGSFSDLFQAGANVTLTIENKKLVRPEAWLVQDMKLYAGESVYFFEGIRTFYSSLTTLFQVYVPEEIGKQIRLEDFGDVVFIRAVERIAMDPVKKALLTSSATVATQTIASKLGIEVGDPVLVQKLIHLSKHQKVLQVSNNYFPGDRYQHTTELERD